MADENRTANVDLTANVSQYNQQVGQASQQTSKLTDQVNKLAASLDGITKRMGKKLLLFAAADAAAVTGYTIAAARYEKQLQTLTAQTAVAGKTMEVYKKGIEAVGRQMPISGKEVAELITQINKLGITSQRETVAMARTFIQLGAATGESISTLTSGLVELSRQMGTLGSGAKGISSFADSLTSVSNTAGVSAAAVLNFSQAIAPMARAAGIGQKEVLGFSAAFTRAGADGYAAANAFNSIVADITRQSMNGSPEIAKYAKTIGVTADEFKKMDSADRIIKIFEAVNAAGPDSVRVLDRMGIDGIRAAKAFQAVASEAGGMRKAVSQAVAEYGGGSTARGAGAAFDSMDSAMTKFRNNLEQIAATMGSLVLPVATEFVDVLNKGLDTINKMAGPLLAVAGALGAVMVPIAAGFGGLLTMLGPLSTLMLAMTAFRLSPVRGLIQGFKEGRAEAAAARLGTQYIPFTQAGQHNADGTLKSYQQGPYNLGNRLGGRLPYHFTGAPSSLGQGFLRAGNASMSMLRGWYIDPTNQWIENAAMRDPFARKSALGDLVNRAVESRKTIGGTLGSALTNPLGFLAARGATPTVRAAGTGIAPHMEGEPVNAVRNLAKAEAEARAENIRRNLVAEGGHSGAYVGQKMMAEYSSTLDAHSKAMAKAATTAKELADAQKVATQTTGHLGRNVAARAAQMAGIPLSYGVMGARLGAQGAFQMGGRLLGSLGNMVGATGPAAPVVGGALILGGAALYGAKQTADATKASLVTSDMMTNLGKINTALGLATKTLGEFTVAVEGGGRSASSIASAADGLKLTIDEQIQAQLSPEKYADERVKNLSGTDAGVGYLMSLGQMSGQQARAASQDLYRKFGPGAQAIIDAYQNQGGGQSTDRTSMTDIAKGLFAGGSAASDRGFVGALRNFGLSNIVGVDSTTTEAVQMAVAASQEQVGNITSKYGAKAGATKQAANYADLFRAVGNADTAGKRKTLEEVIKNFEGQYGELGLFVGPEAITSDAGTGAKNLNNPEDLLRWIVSGQNDSEGSRKFRTSLQNTGMSATDFIGLDANQQAVAMQRGTLSDFEKRVRGTEIGAFSRGNYDVRAISEGTKAGDPAAWGKALRAMTENLTANGASLRNATEQANKLALAVGDVNDPLYQLAMAAKALAVTQGLRVAGELHGEVGTIRQTARNIRATVLNPVDQNDGSAEKEALKSQVNSNVRAYEQYVYQFQKAQKRGWEDFRKSQEISVKEFGISMQRNMEDAAKALYSPWERAFSPATQSLDTVLSNMKEGAQRAAEQMKNLQTLKNKYGLDPHTIDQLQLEDPSKAWEVERLVGDAGMAGGRKKINQLDKSSSRRDTLAERAVGSYQSTQRAMADFARSQDLAADAFHRSVNRAREDFDDYNRHFNGKIDKVTGHIKKMFDKMGINTTDYFEDLKKELGIVTDVFHIKVPITDFSGYGATKNSQVPAFYTQLPVGGENKEGQVNASTGRPWQTKPKETYLGWAVATENGPHVLPSDWGNHKKWTSQKKKEYWDRNHIVALAAGGIVTGPTLAVLAEQSGPEAVLPLSGTEGKAFAAQMAAQITTQMLKTLHTRGRGTPMALGAGSTVNIKNETNYGGVTVQAANLDDFEKQLQRKERNRKARQGAGASQ